MTDTTTKTTMRRTLDTIRACHANTPDPELHLARCITHAAKWQTLDMFLDEICKYTGVPIATLPADIAVGALMAASARDAAKVLAYMRECPYATATACMAERETYETMAGKIEREV